MITSEDRPSFMSCVEFLPSRKVNVMIKRYSELKLWSMKSLWAKLMDVGYFSKGIKGNENLKQNLNLKIYLHKRRLHRRKDFADQLHKQLFACFIYLFVYTTGCHTGTDIKFTVNARPQEHFHTSHIWQNLPYTCTFWICICKNFEAFPIFFKIGRNFDAHILKTAKIHRKLKIKQTSVLFYKYFLNESSDLYEIWDFYSWGSKELSNDFS